MGPGAHPLFWSAPIKKITSRTHAIASSTIGHFQAAMYYNRDISSCASYHMQFAACASSPICPADVFPASDCQLDQTCGTIRVALLWPADQTCQACHAIGSAFLQSPVLSQVWASTGLVLPADAMFTKCSSQGTSCIKGSASLKGRFQDPGSCKGIPPSECPSRSLRCPSQGPSSFRDIAFIECTSHRPFCYRLGQV